MQGSTGSSALFHGTVHFRGFSTGYSTWYFFSTTSAEVPSDPYHYPNVTSKLYWSLIGRRKSSLLRHWTCDTRPNIDPLDLNQRRIGRSFCINPYMSVEETFLSMLAEERIQREIMNILFALCIFLEYVFCVYFYLCICVLLQLKTIWSNMCSSRLY